MAGLYDSLVVAALGVPVQEGTTGARPARGDDVSSFRQPLDTAQYPIRDSVPTPGIIISFDITPNGTAKASVAYLIPFEGERSVEGFEVLRKDVRANQSQYVHRFEKRVRMTVRGAEQSTNREMEKEFVNVLDWNTAEGNRVVNDLKDEGDVEIFRLGTEKVVHLPEQGKRPERGDETGRGESDA